MRLLFWIVWISQLGRACYASLLLGVAIAHRIGWIEVQGSIGQFMSTLAPYLFGLWSLYVTGYIIAAALILLRRRLGYFIFLGALALDLALWVYSSFGTSYQASYAGNAALVDMIFNVIDLGIAMGLTILYRAGYLR